MDDTAQQQPAQSTPVSSQASVVRPMEQPAQNRPVASAPQGVSVSDAGGVAATSVDPLQEAEMVGPPNHEQGPLATPVPALEVPDVPIAESRPSVEVSTEVKDAGVEPGPDAVDYKLSEEVQNVGATLVKEATPVTVSQATPAPANETTELAEAVVAAKASKSAKEALSWRLREIIRELKKKLFAETKEVPKT